MSTTTTYKVSGMTCGHCVGAVTEEITKLSGVSSVDIDLRPDDESIIAVTSDGPLEAWAVAAAVDEAGYHLAST